MECWLDQPPLTAMSIVAADGQAVAEEFSAPIDERAALVEGPIVGDHLVGQVGMTYNDRSVQAEPDAYKVTVCR
jgi:hypothetical protein